MRHMQSMMQIISLHCASEMWEGHVCMSETVNRAGVTGCVGLELTITSSSSGIGHYAQSRFSYADPVRFSVRRATIKTLRELRREYGGGVLIQYA